MIILIIVFLFSLDRLNFDDHAIAIASHQVDSEDIRFILIMI